jgi:AcrR family transcriptional regulator
VPRRPPQQKRSWKTLSRIEEAGLAILRDRGADGLTIQDVVTRARTSVGSFYQRFAGKDELLRHLVGAAAARDGARFDDALAERAPATLPLAARVDVVISLLMEEPPGGASQSALGEAVVRALRSSHREIRHPDPDSAIRIGFAAVSGALRGPPPEGVAGRPLAQELTRLWMAYLGGVEPDRGRGGAVDFFEVWG